MVMNAQSPNFNKLCPTRITPYRLNNKQWFSIDAINFAEAFLRLLRTPYLKILLIVDTCNHIFIAILEIYSPDTTSSEIDQHVAKLSVQNFPITNMKHEGINSNFTISSWWQFSRVLSAVTTSGIISCRGCRNIYEFYLEHEVQFGSFIASSSEQLVYLGLAGQISYSDDVGKQPRRIICPRYKIIKQAAL
jgi:hypothetical protein